VFSSRIYGRWCSEERTGCTFRSTRFLAMAVAQAISGWMEVAGAARSILFAAVRSIRPGGSIRVVGSDNGRSARSTRASRGGSPLLGWHGDEAVKERHRPPGEAVGPFQDLPLPHRFFQDPPCRAVPVRKRPVSRTMKGKPCRGLPGSSPRQPGSEPLRTAGALDGARRQRAFARYRARGPRQWTAKPLGWERKIPRTYAWSPRHPFALRFRGPDYFPEARSVSRDEVYTASSIFKFR
jgi:hypothetical protein